MSDEYNLKRAGFFSEVDLLEFRDKEREHGRNVRVITITPKQAFNLLPNQAKRKRSANPLIDYWYSPTMEGLSSIHGIEVEIENE